jgi:hypothetical protein
VDCVVRGKKDSERDKNNKVDGERGKKSKIFGLHGARENRPITPTKRAPRPALWTTSTSGKALDDKLSNIFTLI